MKRNRKVPNVKCLISTLPWANLVHSFPCPTAWEGCKDHLFPRDFSREDLLNDLVSLGLCKPLAFLTLPKDVDFLVDLLDHVQAVGVDVVLRDVDDLDRVRVPGLFADTPDGETKR